MVRATVSLAAMTLLMAAGSCGSETAEPTTATPTVESTSETAAPAAAVPPDDEITLGLTEWSPQSVDEAIEQGLGWFLTIANGEVTPTVADVEARLSPAFLAQVSPSQFLSQLPLIAAGGPFTVERTGPGPVAGLSAGQQLRGAGDALFDLTIQVGTEPPFLIEGLLIVPADAEAPPEAFDPGTTLGSIDTDLQALAASSALGVYDVTDGACTAVHELRAGEAMPLGSAFKLWILAELAHQIEAGQLGWDTPVTIADELLSSPDGVVFAADTATTMPVAEMAEHMIAISDNSATDHLLALVGRDQVESGLARLGVADHGPNTPMLSTANLFQLKYAASEPNSSDYRALDTDGRRALLERLDAETVPWVLDPAALDMTNADGVAIDQPRDLDIEWYATPGEMCDTMLWLAEAAERPGLEPVAEILAANPGQGLPFDRDRFPTIWFKGGSEPGVLAGVWWVERDDGRRFVIAGAAWDPEQAFDPNPAALALGSAFTLIS